MKNILIVDDDLQLHKLYELIIKQRFEGINLSQAFDGKEALDICSTLDCCVIISDIEMPTMNGIDFYKSLKSVRPELTRRLAFVSASSTPHHISFIKDEGCVYLPKPFKINNFTSMLESMIAKSTDRSGPDLSSEQKRQFPRIEIRERCVLFESNTGLLTSEPLITETVNYSDGGILIEYPGEELPAGSNFNVKIERLNINDKVAQVVWSNSYSNSQKAGLKWI